MFLVILLAALAVTAVAATVSTVSHDGYRQVPLDRTRLP